VGPVVPGGGRTTDRLTGPRGGRFTRQENGAKTTWRLTGPGGRLMEQGYGANRSRRWQDHREANRSRRQAHGAGVWGQ
jgi:hypothetical protein